MAEVEPRESTRMMECLSVLNRVKGAIAEVGHSDHGRTAHIVDRHLDHVWANRGRVTFLRKANLKASFLRMATPSRWG